MAKWKEKWEVPRSDGSGVWVVSRAVDGITWGCSCPRWKFKREECHHIQMVKSGQGRNRKSAELPKYVLAMVNRPDVHKGKMLIPLVVVGNTHQEVTVCAFMLKQGYSWGQVKERRRVPRQWTAKAVLAYVEQHGEALFSNLAGRPGR